jgi:hypothetical protein
MFSEISEWRRVKPPSEIYRPGDLLPYTLRGISRKYALLLGQCKLLQERNFRDIVHILGRGGQTTILVRRSAVRGPVDYRTMVADQRTGKNRGPALADYQ